MKDKPVKNKQTQGLRAASAQYFSQAQLSEQKMAEFEAMLGQGDPSLTTAKRRGVTSIKPNIPSGLKWAGLAASLVLLLSVFINSPSVDMTQKIADEVAMNHIKMKPLEIESRSLLRLRHYFTELDFALSESNEFSLLPEQMLGGRYCSIQGVSAAQIRYLDSAGDGRATLYQVGYDKARYGEQPDIGRGEQPAERLVNGVKVRIWVEKGLLMAEARRP